MVRLTLSEPYGLVPEPVYVPSLYFTAGLLGGLLDDLVDDLLDCEDALVADEPLVDVPLLDEPDLAEVDDEVPFLLWDDLEAL